MHEMSYVLMSIEELNNVIKENDVKELISVTLNIGESSGVEENYFRVCWDAAIKDTPIKNTKLKINMLPSEGRCLSCGSIFNLKENNYTCPNCKSNNAYTPINGKDIEIVEIEAI